MDKYRSMESLSGRENADIRNVIKGMGYSDDDLESGRPVIGIANSWNTIVPGHFNFRQLSEQVTRGIYRAGGTAFEFGVIGLCDAIAKNNFNYVLPSREIIADSIEAMACSNPFDGLVLMASCDKIVPGMLMGAARINIPAILVNGGPMLGGIDFEGRKSDSTSASEAFGKLTSGNITESEFKNIEDLSCPTCGSCSFMGTANTMCCLSEAMGMSLPDSSGIPAVYAERLRLAEQSGEAICRLVKKNILSRDIITSGAIENAIRVCMAVGGSTNAILHLSALAYEAELDINVLELFDSLSRTTPLIARVNPAGTSDMESFWRAGGIPRVIENLKDLLHMDEITCTCRTLDENAKSFNYRFPENREVIRTIEEPFSLSGGIAVMRGNLAPKTGISKPAAIDPEVRQFRGRAVVFNSDEDAIRAIRDSRIKPGHVLVIRYEGPKGGPGMVEMYRSLKYLRGMGLHKSTAVITDGRFSGTNNGCFVGHISPEAAEGGPIAIVKDGDEISIDVVSRNIHLHLSDEEISKRLADWKCPEPKIKRGYLSIYSRLASSADEGAVIRNRF